MANIEGQRDLKAGRSEHHRTTAETTQKTKFFCTIAYTSDGEYLLAAGLSKVICIYNVAAEMLVKRFEVTQNRSLDAMDAIVSRGNVLEGGINKMSISNRNQKEYVPGMYTVR